ncbi:hypothetical protein HMPREF7215_1839 [Pyramidobacter piscolens W5455]|uniref:Uncharacterized protein n=1 Tax=Pyramidobacter piscolens W5455 TaxID=352165 RepID=A0ABM9ZT95_9BACT|nr:hypothetical protein HMPREF7215_1839 [Pyramidobacter piscolens W5455]
MNGPSPFTSPRAFVFETDVRRYDLVSLRRFSAAGPFKSVMTT